MSNDDQLTVIIQAGGQSRRMGQDKALKEFLGEPLALRLVKRLKPLGQDILVIARQASDYAVLNLPIYTDVQPGIGAGTAHGMLRHLHVIYIVSYRGGADHHPQIVIGIE